MSMSADPRVWQGGLEADDRTSYGVGVHQSWLGHDASELGKPGYYQGYGVEPSADRGSYYPDPAHALSADQSAYGGGGGAQVVPIGPSPPVYDGVPHQHFAPPPGAGHPGGPPPPPPPDLDPWHVQMLGQADPFAGLPLRDGPAAKRKRRRVISVEQRKAANVRERRRMYQLNEAFDGLRKRVPTFAYEKKLSRIETLKLAVTYIEFMTDLLDNNGEKCKKLLESGAGRRDAAVDAAAVDRSLDDAVADADDDDDDADDDADDAGGGATVGRSPSQSAPGKRSRDTSDEELCDS